MVRARNRLLQMSDARQLVVCLCAEWCGVCRDYRSRFEQVGSQFPQAGFVWVDVEDQADLVDPVDVENFPMLLIAAGSDVLFFGALTPQIETLERLVRDRFSRMDGSGSTAGSTPEAVALLARLRAAGP